MSEPLTLYHFPSCPFCIKVRRAADALGVPLRLVDIFDEPAARQRLLDARGRATVPVLGVPDADGGQGETLIGESDVIVAYLRDNAETLRGAA